jgi:prepilin-type N-terminal cleavage/methylation domain-containing protein
MQHPRHSSRAFTLIEMMIVILMMALLTSAAMLSFGGPLRAARANDAVDQVRAFDAGSRQYAKRFGKDVQIVFDISENRLVRREKGAELPLHVDSLPRGYSIERVRFGDRVIDGGEIAIPCSSLGLTRSYALHLVGPSLDRWISFAGLTGEMTVFGNESEATDNFQSATARHDAD